MSNMPIWLVPEDDRAFPTGALWRQCRREVRKLVLFYKIVNGQVPDYLKELVPPAVADINDYNLRNRLNMSQPSCRLSTYQQTYFPSTIKLWNTLDLNLRQLPTLPSFIVLSTAIYLNRIWCLVLLVHVDMKRNVPSISYYIVINSIYLEITCSLNSISWYGGSTCKYRHFVIWKW